MINNDKPESYKYPLRLTFTLSVMLFLSLVPCLENGHNCVLIEIHGYVKIAAIIITLPRHVAS